jgi:hypothetical protein
MKKFTTILVFTSICISCNKSLDTPLQNNIIPEKATAAKSEPLETKFLLNGDTVVLKLVMEPAVTCYSYKTSETPRPCKIFIQFTCTLSQPVDGYVKVDVQKTNIVETGEQKTEGSQTENSLAFNIAPNTTGFIYKSSFENNNNILVAKNAFSIENVTYYKKVD